ncbi:DUF5677 domain-containing protein [Maritimibacter sp. DP1N21-5]|uniref:DUF5677 domain-containing protein n=1 Tax=Maritimibacter sp. DP1N21-5 TaxID=2836867 RepID=UPI001C476998|nr:DUF5677 domain-containing protein [Maritimibacter sp. DP1N21-5]MBV7408293.1 hypothetical protein [Maritimibacter sp. DP1N21-5]
MRKPVLSDHKKKKRRLIPPLKAAFGENYSPYHWAVDVIPEVFWLAVFLREPFGPRDMEVLRAFCQTVLDIKSERTTSAVNRMSSFSDLTDDEIREVLKRTPFRSLNILRRGFGPMNEVFEDHPLDFLFEGKVSDAVPLGARKISMILDELYDRHSRISAISLATSVYLLGSQGKLFISSSIKDPAVDRLEEIFKYPDTEESRSVAAAVRAMAPFLFLGSPEVKTDVDEQWHSKFWRSVEGMGPCEYERDTIIPEVDAQSDLERLIFGFETTVKKEFLHRRDVLAFDLSQVEISQVVGCLIARQTTLAVDIASAPVMWTPHSAPIFLRVMADVFITLAWILKAPLNRSKLFIEYGVGNVKLEAEHRRQQLENDPHNINGEDLSAMIEFQEWWVNSQLNSDLLDVNLGSWSGISTRKMAEEAGVLDFYNWVYQPFSASVHSQWQHLSWHNSTSCRNPSHRGHVSGAIPDYNSDNYWLFIAAKYLKKTNDLFDEHYPSEDCPESGLDYLVAFGDAQKTE